MMMMMIEPFQNGKTTVQMQSEYKLKHVFKNAKQKKAATTNTTSFIARR